MARRVNYPPGQEPPGWSVGQWIGRRPRPTAPAVDLTPADLAPADLAVLSADWLPLPMDRAQRARFFPLWAADVIDLGERHPYGTLRVVTRYQPSERRAANFRFAPGQLQHVVVELVGRTPRDRRWRVDQVHHDPHWRRRPAPPKTAAAAAAELEDLQRRRQERGEPLATAAELKRETGWPRALVEKALDRVDKTLKWGRGYRPRRK